MDEKHFRQVIGGKGCQEKQWAFKTDDNSEIGVEHGTYKDGDKVTNLKYAKEARFTFLCRLTDRNGDPFILLPFNCTSESLLLLWCSCVHVFMC